MSSEYESRCRRNARVETFPADQPSNAMPPVLPSSLIGGIAFSATTQIKKRASSSPRAFRKALCASAFEPLRAASSSWEKRVEPT